MHEKLLKIVRTLETDYEPYGKVERDSLDCSCGCRHFVRLAGEVGEEWGVCANTDSARAGLLTFRHQGCPQFEPILLDRALTDSQLRTLISEASEILKDRRRERTDSITAEETPLPDERGEFLYDLKTTYFPHIKGHVPAIFRLEPHDHSFVAVPLASRTTGSQRPTLMGRHPAKNGEVFKIVRANGEYSYQVPYNGKIYNLKQFGNLSDIGLLGLETLRRFLECVEPEVFEKITNDARRWLKHSKRSLDDNQDRIRRWKRREFWGDETPANKKLHTSHLGFFHRSARRASSRAALSATYLEDETEYGKRWIFQDVHAGGAASAAGIEPGDILLSVNDQDIIPPEHPVFTMGEKTSVEVVGADEKKRKAVVDVARPKGKKLHFVEPKLVEARHLNDGVGYLKIAMFPGMVGVEVANDISRSLAALGEIDRLVIDLRGNTGGGIGALRVMSLLTPTKIPVGFALAKNRVTANLETAKHGFRRFNSIPESKSSLWLLAAKFGAAMLSKSPIVLEAEGLGAKRFHGRVVVLVDRHTASAAEMIVALRRADNPSKRSPKAAYDPDGTKNLATLVSEANDDFGQAEPARFAAIAFVKNGSPVYLYRFSYVQTGMRQMLRAGTPHGGEIAFVFGTLGTGGFGPPPPPATDEDREVSRMAQGYWVNFARTGDPNGAGLPTWPRYDPGKDLIFAFHPDGSAGAIPDPWKLRLDVMQKATESGKRADF